MSAPMPRTASEVIARLHDMGITLVLDGDQLRARPSILVATNRGIGAMVGPLRQEIIELLRSPSPIAPEDYLIDRHGFCTPAPAYCLTCGNLDFYGLSTGWRCKFCQPQMVRPITYSRAPKPMPARRPKPIPTFGEAHAIVPKESWFSLDEICWTWPMGWTPPHPVSTARKVAAMSAEERADRAAWWADKIAFDERQAEFLAVAASDGRNAINAIQQSDSQAICQEVSQEVSHAYDH